MDNENKNDREEKFSDDPEKNLRIENEILKLKMQAERGAVISDMEELSPHAEAEMLRSVEAFEDSFDRAEMKTIYEFIGKPEYRKAEELKPEEFESGVNKLMELLQSKNIQLDVLGQYDPSIIYKFITDELFLQEISDIQLPGYMHCYVYEEFHPNHFLDIGRAVEDFINHWFEKRFNEYCTEFESQLMTAEGKVFPREEVIQKLVDCVNSYQSFTNIKFAGFDTSYDWDDEAGKGLGHAEGFLSYDAVLENGESVHVEGPFKIYLSNEYGFWLIFYFIFPGFAW